jgi:hypothetical protein
MNNTTQLRLEPEQPDRTTSHGLNNLHSALTTLIDKLDESIAAKAEVIEWGCPVLSFGDLSNSRVASMGLNPSNREFVDESGKELQGESRRFHTLNSLGLSSWADVDARHLELILESCSEYFLGNPYDTWFKKLDRVIQGAEASFYDTRNSACHLDLIPYATARKWTELASAQRASLLAVGADTLGLLLRDSPIRILILNGQTVVDQFQAIAGVSLEKQTMPEWTLSRNLGRQVVGFGYIGTVTSVSGINLQHDVLVLGYNHNLQSSFGVTTEAINAIRNWISRAAREAIP